MIFKCQCCGFEKEFRDGEEAFAAGWDSPPYFTGYVSCNLCPGSFVVTGTTYLHARDHQLWKDNGRPSEFEIPLDEEGNVIL
jgi:hypothetical protein